MGGWFDAFRTEGGPTLYSYSNRTPVTGDPPTIALYVLFASLGIAFLIIFPGIRKERVSTFCSVALSLFVGSTILVSKYGSGWEVGEVEVSTAYRAFSRDRVNASLGIHIGLSHFNVTLQGVNSSSEIDFNERFYWEEADALEQELRSALQKGLPFPILTVLEYFSLDEEGFSWGRDYRMAGYVAGILLWASFCSWLLMNLLVVVVPRYGAYQMVLTGSLLLLTDLFYLMLLPHSQPLIRMDGAILHFRLGPSFWMVLAGGGACLSFGALIAVIDLLFPHKFSTVLEVDYDTPYDRHIIIQDSTHTRKKKKSLEDPQGIGKRILRTLSRGGKEEGLEIGHPNEGFQMEPPIPNSPWRHGHGLPRERQTQLRGSLASAFAKNPALLRLAAPNPQKSPKAVSFRRQSGLETRYNVEERRKDSASSSEVTEEESHSSVGSPSMKTSQDPSNLTRHLRGMERSESTDSRNSSVSSFGLGLLSRTPSEVHGQTPSRKKPPPNNNPRHVPLQRVTHYSRSTDLPRPTLNRHSSNRSEESYRHSVQTDRNW